MTDMRHIEAGSVSWFLSTARERLTRLLDQGSFTEFLPPTERVQSPHLALFDLPAAFDDGMIVGRGRLEGRDVLVAGQEGQFMGGTFAEVSGAKLVGLLRAARDDAKLPRTVLLLLDSGGVRLQEANAGELAVAEVMRAIVEARAAGVAVIALVGGRAGAFGGAGLTAATCSAIAISEQGRTGVTGPEVIETNKGVEEFDSQDKALVWSVTGGRTRRLIGGADAYVDDSIAGFRGAALALMDRAPTFDLATLKAEQARLAVRAERLGACNASTEMWATLGVPDPQAIGNMDDNAFRAVVAGVEGTDHDAR
ncbi:biotin-independent malonate decarboxylase subunit beta [Xanthobacter dioxanivorans]|uniref:Biotin-independent malonate decarboxylase subunit beta n=1 Tax=Xanthobacter dioxanivorans TaxID=2528964 RepID=A0A974PR87_9HYPH|nr:biotin-independent malonate decarboxylase subunit beta [Xanthobacter dioxanivorans]QRG07878.1 biotin-independent malonate decarboxylase subunit beta [Xanthobacter dioxanivorans]